MRSEGGMEPDGVLPRARSAASTSALARRDSARSAGGAEVPVAPLPTRVSGGVQMGLRQERESV